MNLELAEQRCLSYLQQVANPMVSLQTLLAHLWQQEETADITSADLLPFLRKHEFVHVIESDPESDPEQAEAMAEAGFSEGPYIILRTRIPTKTEMAQLMNEQIETMLVALQKALQEAIETGDDEGQQRLRELLDRSQEFKDKLGMFK